jgi:hypothetical protein
MNAPVKPAKYYIVMDSETQKESVQNLFRNINSKTHQNNGVIMEEALNCYWNLINVKKVKI